MTGRGFFPVLPAQHRQSSGVGPELPGRAVRTGKREYIVCRFPYFNTPWRQPHPIAFGFPVVAGLDRHVMEQHPFGLLFQRSPEPQLGLILRFLSPFTIGQLHVVGVNSIL